VATLLFLGASVSQLPAIRHAQAAGHRVVAVDGDPDAVGFDIADVCVNVDFSHVEQVAAAGKEQRADGVLAVSSDRAVVPAAVVAELLGLPGIGVEVARAMTDKPTMRARLARAGVPQPRYAVVTANTDLESVVPAMAFPAVLKPADSGGQRGLFMIRSPADVDRHLDATLAFSSTGRAMLEEFVDGTELNGIIIVRDGEPTLVTLSDRLRPAGAGFGVGWIHVFPSSLDPAVLERAREVAFDAVRVLGLRDGIAFPQLIASGDDVRLIEIAARIAAGQMADLVRAGAGIELFDVAIAQALGRPVPDTLVVPGTVCPVAIRFLTAAPGILPLGTVTAIHGLGAVRASPGVVGAGLYFDVGVTITPVQVDADRRGYVVAMGETPEEALELADAAARKLLVRTRRELVVAWNARFLVPGAAAVIAAAVVALAAVVVPGAVRPRLLSETVRAHGGRLQVLYAFNEPVRAELLVNGRPATGLSSLRRRGELLWRDPGGVSGPVAIEGIDRSGRRAVFSVVRRVPGVVRVRHRGAA
jgi:biotin carboxylase